MIGRVVSVKLKNTVTVLEERLVKHSLYKKTYAQSKKYLVHDLIGVKVGDIVNYVSCRPVSKNKHWKINKVLGTNFAEIAEGQLKEQAENTIAEIMPEEKEESKKLQSENSEIKIADDKEIKKTRTVKKGKTELSK